MKNQRAYIRFWLAVIAASALISLMGCSHYYIEQEVHSFGGRIGLLTTVNENDGVSYSGIIKRWYDTEITDSVKCLRYNQAKELIEKIESIENFKCE